MMQHDQKGCKKNNTRAEEEQTIAARTKQHEDEVEHIGIRHWGYSFPGRNTRALGICQVELFSYRKKTEYVQNKQAKNRVRAGRHGKTVCSRKAPPRV